MDADEIAGLECSFQCDGFLSHSETEQLIRGTKSLIDALEQARKERDEIKQVHDAALKQWNPVYKIVLDERDDLRKRVEDMRLANVGMETQRDQAQKERDMWKGSSCAMEGYVRDSDDKIVALTAQRDAAQKDAKDARALLEAAKNGLPSSPYWRSIRARIEAMLEKKR